MSRNTDIVRLKSGAAREAERRRIDLQFLPAALEIAETPPSPTARVTALALIGVLFATLAWAYFGKIDIIAAAPGRVIPSGRTKVVQPFEIGVVRAINVADGQHVAARQVLLVLDPTASRAERDKAAHDLILARLNAARAKALLDGDIKTFAPPPDADPVALTTTRGLMEAQARQQEAKLAALDHQLAERQAEIAQVEAEIQRIDATMPMLEAHLKIRTEGLKTGFGSKLDYYDAKRLLVSQQQERGIDQTKLDAAKQALESSRHQREEAVSQYRSGLLEDLSKAQAGIAGLEQDVLKMSQRAELQTLRAPIDGTVQQLAVHTLGGIVTPAQALLAIVPDENSVEIHAMVPNREVGFVNAGQAADIKVEALEFTRYGLLHGTVTRVSRDVVGSDEFHLGPAATPANRQQGAGEAPNPPDGDPEYVATILVRERGLPTEQGFVPLEPGMTVMAEIKTGRRRVIDYLLSPLKQYSHDSLRER